MELPSRRVGRHLFDYLEQSVEGWPQQHPVEGWPRKGWPQEHPEVGWPDLRHLRAACLAWPS